MEMKSVIRFYFETEIRNILSEIFRASIKTYNRILPSLLESSLICRFSISNGDKRTRFKPPTYIRK